MRLAKAVDRFLAWRQLERDATPKSLDSYWRTLRAMTDWLESRAGEDVRLTDLEGRKGTELLREFIAADCGRLSASTRSTRISYLHSFWRWALEEDLIEADPAAPIRRPPKRKPDIYRPDATELLMGRRACEIEELPAWLLMEGVGLRASSVTRCRWEHVDLRRGRVRAFTKGQHWQTFPIDAEVLEELRRVYRDLEPAPDDHVFTVSLERWETNEHRVRTVRDPKRPASEKALWTLVQRVCKRAGIRPVGPHALRHGFATRLRRRGLAKEEIQQLLGHADAKSTEAYLDELRLDELEDALSGRDRGATLQALPSSRMGPRNLASRLVEAAGIEPASGPAEGERNGETGLDDPSPPEGGVT